MDIQEDRNLACSVIDLARKDFINNKSSQSTIRECYDFITGKSPMSRFWFDRADLPFMSGGIKALRVKLILIEETAQEARDELRRKEKRKQRAGKEVK